ncbi:uncharacterized protein EI90DRAFT_2326407 [Cantharellus anzutake]|uniref:uncharacterized protein n=1 Tax=Cantharellus anzutake TaxID=1750568 RepID=UPI00190668C8|nr:uncharacterized protein EI90DRAFT_2326407 [Cantharellus anzutake]KAF8324579.1 hypothetical protein EI90DRAFT_2326407 [Cantharellus anzutake]
MLLSESPSVQTSEASQKNPDSIDPPNPHNGTSNCESVVETTDSSDSELSSHETGDNEAGASDDDDEQVYRLHQENNDHSGLPTPSIELMKAIHSIASNHWDTRGLLRRRYHPKFEERVLGVQKSNEKKRAKQIVESNSKPGLNMYRSMDPSAMLALGILVQQVIYQAVRPPRKTMCSPEGSGNVADSQSPPFTIRAPVKKRYRYVSPTI